MSLETLLNEKHSLHKQICKIDREVWELLKKYRTSVTKKEYKVLKMRLYERMTLENVGKELGVTRERIRQIECKAVYKMDDKIAKNEV